jgi:hypothetical protein
VSRDEGLIDEEGVQEDGFKGEACDEEIMKKRTWSGYERFDTRRGNTSRRQRE